MSDHKVSIAGLFVHPVKSCAGVAVDSATLIETGFEWDRQWMVVDEHGEFVTQRERPRMALVQPTLRGDDMVLRAPGMLALHVALYAVEHSTKVRVWDDWVRAFDMGDLAAQWFSDFLGLAVRLVRFDPDEQRVADLEWTGAQRALTAFADGFPLLVLSTASVAEINRRLALQGAAPVHADRFRPNLLLDGLDAHAEDWLDRIEFESTTGPVALRLVKPCTRCSIPDVDPRRGEHDAAVGATLASYRADPRLNGQVTFGMNAIVEQGLDCSLRVGAQGHAALKFD
jgi:hypothetical protein